MDEHNNDTTTSKHNDSRTSRRKSVRPIGNHTNGNGKSASRTGGDDEYTADQIAQEDIEFLTETPENSIPFIGVVADVSKAEKTKTEKEKSKKETKKTSSSAYEPDEKIETLVLDAIDGFLINRFGEGFTPDEKTSANKHLGKIVNRLGLNDKVIDNPLFDVIMLIIVFGSVGMRIKTSAIIKEDFSEELKQYSSDTNVVPIITNKPLESYLNGDY